MSKPSTVDKPAVFLEEHGVLFEIDRPALHPPGLELHLIQAGPDLPHHIQESQGGE